MMLNIEAESYDEALEFSSDADALLDLVKTTLGMMGSEKDITVSQVNGLGVDEVDSNSYDITCEVTGKAKLGVDPGIYRIY